MNRRSFLKAAAVAAVCTGSVPKAFAELLNFQIAAFLPGHDNHVRDYLYKIRNFDKHHRYDVCLEQPYLQLLKSALHRLRRLQKTVGHGHFYLLNFDDALKIAKNYPRVGRFSRSELDFMEMIFYEDSKVYGFLGEKPFQKMTDRIETRKVVKIPRTGNYLYKGKPFETYNQIRKDVGDRVILTSGIRSVTKQFMLFLDKTYRHGGNLSLASRSLAPPGYSFHGVGDFDVGQIGLGSANFTEKFTKTPVFSKLDHLGYVDLRYRKDNLLGVRFEPWHIKVHETV